MQQNDFFGYMGPLDKKYCDHLIKKFELHKEHQKKIQSNTYSFTEINMNQHNDWKDYIKVLMTQLYKKYIEKYVKDNNINLNQQWPEKYAFEGLMEILGEDEFEYKPQNRSQIMDNIKEDVVQKYYDKLKV